MAYGGNIGQPWLHKGVKCAKCEVTPISGYRYKCKKRPDYNLCQACFRREIPDPKVKYLKIERSKITGPYQVHFIECAECGIAPIKGKRYRHKTQEDCDLCESCYLRATNPSNRRAQSESDYELFEELIVNSVCRKYNQVFHFDKRCDECLVSPICGPTFTSLKNPDYDLCAFCHDEKLQGDSIKLGDFVSRDKPDVGAVYHLNIICCIQCGMTPIKGPAFRHRRDPNKTLCLVCHYNVQEDKQRYFTRIDPPRQAEKGGPTFRLKPKASAQVQGLATKTVPSKTSAEAVVLDVSSTTRIASKSDHVPAQGVSSLGISVTDKGDMAPLVYGGISSPDSNGTDYNTTSDSNQEAVLNSRGHDDKSDHKSSGMNPISNHDSNDETVVSQSSEGRSSSIFKSSVMSSSTAVDSNEEGVAFRGHGARTVLNTTGIASTPPGRSPSPRLNRTEMKISSPISYTGVTNLSVTSDSKEEARVTTRGYGARGTTNTNGTISIPPGRTPSPNRVTINTSGTTSIPLGRTPSPGRVVTNTNGTTSVPPGRTPSPSRVTRREIKTQPPPLYTAGLRTNRPPPPSSPRLRSLQPGHPLQSALKVPSSSPKPVLKVTFAEPDVHSSVEFSPSLQPPLVQDDHEEINFSPPQSYRRLYPSPLAENCSSEDSVESFTHHGTGQQRAEPSSNLVYPPPPQPETAVTPLHMSSYTSSSHSIYPPSPSQSQSDTITSPPQVSNSVSNPNSVYPPPPSSQSQSNASRSSPQVPNHVPGFPASMAEYLAAMTATQNSSAQHALAMLNAIRIEKERSNLALLEQILQRTQGTQQPGVDYSTRLGSNGGSSIDHSSSLNNGGSSGDCGAFLATMGGGGVDLSALLATVGGGNVDLAALLSGQNSSGGLVNVINNLGALGLN